MTKLIVQGESAEDIASALSIIQGLIEQGYKCGDTCDIKWDLTED